MLNSSYNMTFFEISFYKILDSKQIIRINLFSITIEGRKFNFDLLTLFFLY
jgi:hypothetical protein